MGTGINCNGSPAPGPSTESPKAQEREMHSVVPMGTGINYPAPDPSTEGPKAKKQEKHQVVH